MRERIIRCSLLLVIVILLIVGIVKLIGGIVHLASKGSKKNKTTTEQSITTETVTTEEPVANIDPEICAKALPKDKEAALEILTKQGETDADIKNICDNSAIFMDCVLTNLAVNPELKDYAMNYAANINIVFDGDFSIEVPSSGGVPLYLQYDPKWGYADYGKELLATIGAGPTCLSMVVTYMKQDGSLNPIRVGDFSMENNYLSEDGETSWSLMTDGAKSLGLEFEELTLSKEALIKALDDGKGIICAVGSGDFTKEKSFIVIKEFKNGFFYVNDPSSQARSKVGWDYKRLSSQISNVWAYKNGAEAAGSNDGDNAGNNDTDGNNDNTDGGNAGDNTDGGDAAPADNNNE